MLIDADRSSNIWRNAGAPCGVDARLPRRPTYGAMAFSRSLRVTAAALESPGPRGWQTTQTACITARTT